MTEYDLQNESGVLGYLEENVHYTYFVFPGTSVKNNIEMNFYQRPTIQWSLECEERGLTRQYGYDFILSVSALRESVTKEDCNGFMMGVVTIMLVVFGPVMGVG